MMNKVIKKLPKDESRLFKQLYELSFDGLSSILYKNELNKGKDQYLHSKYRGWFISTSNAYLDEAILKWCMIFGSWSEPAHYYTLLKAVHIKSTLNNLGIDSDEKLKLHLLDEASLTELEFDAYHQETKDYRDRYLVHREHSPRTIGNGDLSHPELIVAEKTFMALINVLHSLANELPNLNEQYTIFYYDIDSSDIKSTLINAIPPIALIKDDLK